MYSHNEYKFFRSGDVATAYIIWLIGTATISDFLL